MSSILSRHVAALTAGDAAATAALYADGAQLVSFDGVAEGRDAIAARYTQFFAYHGDISGVEILHERDAGDASFVLFAVESARGRFELVNVYLADGDHIGRHFSNETKATMARDEVVTDVAASPAASSPAPSARGDAAPADVAVDPETQSPEGTTAAR